MPADWMLARLHPKAVRVETALPPDHREVLVWVTDASVAIYHFPTVARRDGREWWAGTPGNWLELTSKRWTVTHWLSIKDLA